MYLTSDGRVLADGWSSDGQTGQSSCQTHVEKACLSTDGLIAVGLGHYRNVTEPSPVVGAVERDGSVRSIHTCGDTSFAIGCMCAVVTSQTLQLADR